MRYFILHKPPGCVTARIDDEGRPTVYDHVPPHYPRLPHVGRLDFNTEGLLLFTDDGRLAQGLLNQSFGQGEPVEKVYHVKVKERLEASDARLEQLARPLNLDAGRQTAPARVRLLEQRDKVSWVEVVICEGKNRQVRRLCERSDLQIRKLRRVRFGPLELGELPVRWCRPLTPEEVLALYEAGLPGEAVPGMEAIEDTPEAYEAAKARRDQEGVQEGVADFAAAEDSEEYADVQ